MAGVERAANGGYEQGNIERHWVMRVTYAFATALFICFPHIGQGEANTALTGTMLRRLGARDADAIARLAQGLGVWDDGVALAETAARGRSSRPILRRPRHADPIARARFATRGSDQGA